MATKIILGMFVDTSPHETGMIDWYFFILHLKVVGVLQTLNRLVDGGEDHLSPLSCR